MIYIGLGSNLTTIAGNPANTIITTLSILRDFGINVEKKSSLYESAPIGPKDQPSYINAAARIQWVDTPQALMHRLHEVENHFARQRDVRWQARTLDLDLLDMDGMILPDSKAWEQASTSHAAPQSLILPHPHLHERRFVLQPLLEIAPDWQHPILGSGQKLLRGLGDQSVLRL
ncbi:7,8-dihydro-6-hydroxymethylpterin-pyrophosphokina se [Iodidimonas nitroreducens]|uniref:2-amino-4-hydroxy-6-hydroxymethyldihydropteridine pyrophosphokinase n=1 Tax=Iodidimonas nitroreducens TaxID=1236968 RepID=A0A5A7NA05_9PROT|nr:2-amino-4-hydroxy-6-hydroxymethyldihydropteridine diphosphokinase [Iodidimonas nitroreducens]GAK32544.1 2-amino-4-hydroxy-6-hydroxymethyldihydropteridine pyrophosphokinase [alpha proteobacterium Q-1]GER04564.1 7,8-dihydro-6-hydroxymethylpterin-pyrophosphokina se [Iodidimonas nitroreducens]